MEEHITEKKRKNKMQQKFMWEKKTSSLG